MAFENIGIGGVLKFDSKGAEQNMGRAARAFNGLKDAAQQMGRAVSTVGRGISQLAPGGALVSLLGGITIGSLIKEGVQFNRTMESSKNAIATIFSTVRKTPIEAELNNAGEALQRLNTIAAQAPGELTDLVGIFQQLAGPVTAAKGDMETMLDMTKGTAILAGILKRTFQDTGAAMSKLQAGQMESGNDIIMMLKSMGLITEDAATWREMLPEDRLKRMKSILDNFAGSGKLVEGTLDAQASTLKSIRTIMAGAFTESITKKYNETLKKINGAFYANEKLVLATTRALGDQLGAALDFVGEQVIETGKLFVQIFTYVRAEVNEAISFINKLGYTIDKQLLGKVVFLGTAFTTLTIAAAPFVAALTFMAGKFMAIFTIVRGLGMMIAVGLAGPMLVISAIAAALFVLFRKTGEGPMETLRRGWEAVKNVGLQLWQGIQPLIQTAILAFYQLVDIGMQLWQGIQPGFAYLREAIAGLINLVVGLVQQLSPIIGGLITSILTIVEKLRPGVEIIFNLAAKIIALVVGIVSRILPPILAVVGTVVKAVSRIAVQVAEVITNLVKIAEPIIKVLLGIIEYALLPVVGFLLDVLSPVFRVTFWMIGTFIQGVVAVISGLIKAIVWLGELVAGAFKWAWEGLKPTFQSVGQFIQTWIVAPLEKAIGFVTDIIGAVSDAGSAISNWLGEDQVPLAAALREIAPVTNATADAVAKLTNQIKTANAVVTTLGETARITQMVKDATVSAKVTPDVNVNNEVNIKSDLCIDGRKMAVASARHQTEIEERAGFNQAPYQQRRVQITGVKVP